MKKLLYWPWSEYRVLRDAAAVLFTSEEERRLARESFSLYRCNEAVVNYGTAAPEIDLETARQEFFEVYPKLHGQPFFLFLGRLHEKKGCDLLINAFGAVRASSGGASPMHLVLAGPCANEEYLRRLRQLARKAANDDSSITFTGMLTGNRKWGAFSAAEAFVLPSHQENFGIAVAEALASGTPVLISNQVNIWREIEAAGAGYVEKDDLEGTRHLLERWLATPSNQREAMRTNARECFSSSFEINRAVDSLLRILSAAQPA
jgi:glycosyltransferase involved in cell wall biosynthesis